MKKNEKLLKEFNVSPFNKNLYKTRKIQYPDRNIFLKNALSISAVPMTYVVNKSL